MVSPLYSGSLLLVFLVQFPGNFVWTYGYYSMIPHVTFATFCLLKLTYCIAGRFGELTRFEYLVKKVWQINRSANRLLIVSTNLDGFSLVNHGRFTKFAKLSPVKVSRYTVCVGGDCLDICDMEQ